MLLLPDSSGPLAGINQMSQDRLPLEQKATTRLITENRKDDHITLLPALVSIC